MRRFFFLLTLVAPLFHLVAADPQFQGTWKLSMAQSEIHPRQSPPPELIKVDQQDGQVAWAAVVQPPATPFAVKFTTDGKETRNRFGDKMIKTMTKWEGDRLLINAIVNDPAGDYTLMDRWRLSRDGNKLTIRRQVVRRGNEVESNLVYERQ